MFEVQSLIGTGGMGSVYRARHLLIDRMCAIKILRTDPGEDSKQQRRRFQNEAGQYYVGLPRVRRAEQTNQSARLRNRQNRRS